MPAWIVWLTEHWFAALLLIGVMAAILYVITNFSRLFYKE